MYDKSNIDVNSIHSGTAALPRVAEQGATRQRN